MKSEANIAITITYSKHVNNTDGRESMRASMTCGRSESRKIRNRVHVCARAGMCLWFWGAWAKVRYGKVHTGSGVGTRIRCVCLDTVRTPPIRETVRIGRSTLAILRIVTMLSGCRMICSTQQEGGDI